DEEEDRSQAPAQHRQAPPCRGARSRALPRQVRLGDVAPQPGDQEEEAQREEAAKGHPQHGRLAPDLAATPRLMSHTRTATAKGRARAQKKTSSRKNRPR